MTADSADAAAQRDRLERLFQATPVPLFVLDAEGGILHANHRARHTLGRTAGALATTRFEALVDPAWRRRTLACLGSALDEDRPRAADAGLLTSDGKTLFARLEVIPIAEPGGHVLLVALLVLTEDTANLHLVGDTFDTTRDRVRALSERYDRS